MDDGSTAGPDVPINVGGADSVELNAAADQQLQSPSMEEYEISAETAQQLDNVPLITIQVPELSSADMDVAGQEEISAEVVHADVVEHSSLETGATTDQDNNLGMVFVEEEVQLIADGASGLMAEHYIETAGQLDDPQQQQQQIIAYIEQVELPDNQNVPVVEQSTLETVTVANLEDALPAANVEEVEQPVQELQAPEVAQEVEENFLEEQQPNEMNNVEELLHNVDQGHQDQHQDVSPSSDSVEPFGSRQGDQELQVVPDSSTAAVPDRSRFLNENLHEAMDPLVDRQSPAASALGVQMVPTSNDLGRMVDVQSSSTLQAHEGEFEQGQQNNDELESGQEQQVDDQLQHVQDEIHEDEVQGISSGGDSEQRQTVPISTLNVPPIADVEDHAHLHNEETSRINDEQQELDQLQQQLQDQEQHQALYAFQGSDQTTYEVCVTLPATGVGQISNEDVDRPGENMQEIPIDISDWTDLSGQTSLVAFAEDGTTIPLTVVRQGPDGEIGLTYDAINGVASSSEVQQILQELSRGSMQLNQVGRADVQTADINHEHHHLDVVENSILPDDSGVVHVQVEQNQQQSNESHIPEETIAQSGVEKPKRTTKVTPTTAKKTTVRKPRSTPLKKSIMPTTMLDIAEPAPLSSVISVDPSSASTGVPEDAEMLIELSNTTPSAISPENMQSLIQILQSLPATSRGQTIQIILQTDPLPSSDAILIQPSPNVVSAQLAIASTSATTALGRSIVQTVDDHQLMRVVQKVQSRRLRIKKTTSDIAIQVTPEFIESAQSEIRPAGDQIQSPDISHLQTDVGAEVSQEASTSAAEQTSKTIDASEAAAMSEDERSRQMMAVITESSRKRRAYRKKNSKQIVTVEEQWVTDPKPGVSYYAVVDYLSEMDPDGFSSASEMKRPEAISSGFMEDHLELQSMPPDGNTDLEPPKNRSLLESTVDSTVIVSPFRRPRINKLKELPAIVVAAEKSIESTSIDLPTSFCESGVTLEEHQESDFDESTRLELQQDPNYEPPDDSQSKKKGKTKRLTKKQSSPRKSTRRAAVRYEHKCGYCNYDSQDKILVVEHCIAAHPEMRVKTLSLIAPAVGRACPYCHQHFDHIEFFAHMRFAHSEVHPYKCGYCDFMGRDRNQIRHHIQKKHRLPAKIINLMDPSRSSSSTTTTNQAGGDDGESHHQHQNHHGNHQHHRRSQNAAVSEGEESIYEYRTDEEELDDLGEDDQTAGDARRGLSCPECKKTFKTLKYLKTHIKVHQSHRYQCGYCDFISIMLHQVLRHCQKKHGDVVPKVLTKELEPEKHPVVARDMDDIIKKVFSLCTRLPRDPDQTKWMRKWFCPHCDYTCQFGASYRRHLRMHANILPYKCNYCSFKGRERYYVRRHISRMHPELPGIVVENNPENCARDTSSDEDFQEKGLRRKRRRRTKDELHAVVPLDDADSMQEQYQQQPIRSSGNARWTSDAESEPEVAPPPPKSRKRAARQRPPQAVTATDSEADLDMDLVPTKETSCAAPSSKDDENQDNIVCKACNQKVAVKSFQQHASQHFKKIVPFKCAYCNYMSVKSDDIRTHSYWKHGSMPVRTEECHLASLAPRDFVALIGGCDDDANDEATDEPPRFTCPLCQSLVDYDEAILSDHFYAHFEFYPFKCSECEHQNVSEEKVREHAIVHGGPYVVYQTDQEKPEGLEDTIQQFLQEGQELVQRKLMELMDRRLLAEQTKSKTTATQDAAEIEVSHVFLCPVCKLQMDMKAGMVRRHLYDHYSYKPFKCAHCRYVGLSRTGVRSHAANKHRNKPAEIVVLDKLMPEDLAKMLREIDKQLKIIRGEQLQQKPQRDTTTSNCPASAEGKSWLDKLSKNVCPWCDCDTYSTGAKLRLHLLTHFGGKRLEFNCAHCDEAFARRFEVNQHIVMRHPGAELRFNQEVSEDTIRRGLRLFLDSESDKNHVDDQDQDDPKSTGKNKDLEENQERSTKKASEVPHELSEKNSNDKVSENSGLSSDDDNDIVTVEGVLLTRTFRSETEGSDDDDDYDEYGSDSDDADEDKFLIGDLDPELVEDIREILNGNRWLQSSAASSSKSNAPECTVIADVAKVVDHEQEQQPAEDIFQGPVFVCGYCDFFSQDQDVTKAHAEKNHSNMTSGEAPTGEDKKKSEVSSKRKVRCRGGRGFKRTASAVKTIGSTDQATKNVSKRCRLQDKTVQDEEELLDDVINMVSSQVDAEIEMEMENDPRKAETLENIIEMVQSGRTDDDDDDDEQVPPEVKRLPADSAKDKSVEEEIREHFPEGDDVVVEIVQIQQPEEETLENIIRMVQSHEGSAEKKPSEG